MEYAVDDSWEMPDYIKKMSSEETRREIEKILTEHRQERLAKQPTTQN
jgi:hypothetical protein